MSQTMGDLQDRIQRIIDNHEKRIGDLEYALGAMAVLVAFLFIFIIATNLTS